jgi:hypothetical protein
MIFKVVMLFIHKIDCKAVSVVIIVILQNSGRWYVFLEVLMMRYLFASQQVLFVVSHQLVIEKARRLLLPMTYVFSISYIQCYFMYVCV